MWRESLQKELAEKSEWWLPLQAWKGHRGATWAAAIVLYLDLVVVTRVWTYVKFTELFNHELCTLLCVYSTLNSMVLKRE